jgi:hypothetical protein
MTSWSVEIEPFSVVPSEFSIVYYSLHALVDGSVTMTLTN